jgi:hypothetical protein
MINESKKILVETEKNFRAALESYQADMVVYIVKHLEKECAQEQSISYNCPADRLPDLDFDVIPGMSSALESTVRAVLYNDYGFVFNRKTTQSGVIVYEFTKIYWTLAGHIDEVVTLNKSKSEGIEFKREQFFNKEAYKTRKEKFDEIWKKTIEIVSSLNDVEMLGSGSIRVKYNESKHQLPEEEG